ncbi:MAG: cysteine hydrolase [Deltaproteobacteria bacterium]|nr:cysteine hydrolase [Deltaproteobacteria bacterium]
MKTILGKNVFMTLEEIISPGHTALIIVDAQNDFCSSGGCIDRLSPPARGIMESYMEHSAPLLDAARKAGVMIIYTQATNHESGIYKSGPDLRRKIEYLDPENPLICIDGTWGHDIVNDLKPLPREIVIKKHRHNSFAGTELDMILRSHRIESLIITGVTTERCVLATIVGAIAHDYYVVVPVDCVAAPKREVHDAALLVIAGNLCEEGVVDSGAIIDAWKR